MVLFRRMIRGIVRTTPGYVAGKVAYEVAAQIAARALVSIPGVAGVYAGGSLRSEWLSPGYSDIDLTLLVRVPTLEDELEFRRELRRRVRLLNCMAPVFRDQNYIEVEDLPLLRRYTDHWGIDLDGRWKFLAGERIPPPVEGAPVQPPRARRLANAVAIMRRWHKASSNLLDPDPPGFRTIETESRGVERLLADCLAVQLDVDRQTLLPELLAGLSRQGRDISDWAALALAPRSRDPVQSRARVIRLIGVTLGEVERIMTEVSRDWGDEPWTSTPDSVLAPSAIEAACPVAESALAEGFEHVALVSRLGLETTTLVVPPEEDRAESIARHVRLLGRVPRLEGADLMWGGQRPVLVTRPLWRTAALLEPPPFVAELLARGRYQGWGKAPPPASVRPDPSDWEELLRTRGLLQFRRARARAFRVGKPEDAFAREVFDISAGLDRLTGVAALAPAGAQAQALTERELLARHRSWMDARRVELRELGFGGALPPAARSATAPPAASGDLAGARGVLDGGGPSRRSPEK